MDIQLHFLKIFISKNILSYCLFLDGNWYNLLQVQIAFLVFTRRRFLARGMRRFLDVLIFIELFNN